MHDHHQDGKLDLVPMIDCIMLLLLFFLLTSSFSSPEGILSAMLPPKGQLPTPVVDPKPPEIISVVALPDHLGVGKDAQDWERRWKQSRDQGGIVGDARIRVGGSEPFVVKGPLLGQRGPEAKEQLDALHAYIRSSLLSREKAQTARKDQYPVEIHCFSGLPWKVTMVIYDAVRAYELERDPSLKDWSAVGMANARPVAFGAPPIRDADPMRFGSELLGLATRR